jgi:outer membrane protein
MMKKYLPISLLACLMFSGALSAAPEANVTGSSLKVGVVNFKDVVEHSKYGKFEQGNFETLKKQMESVLEDKEKTLTELTNKFNDQDYVDSLSTEAEADLKHKFRMINQELGQIQAQYYQTLNQANMKILQKLNEIVGKSAEKIAKDSGLDLILNEDGSFYYAPHLDISKKVIAALDLQYDVEVKNNANNPAKGFN